MNHQNLSIERYRVRGADHPTTSKSQPPRAKAPRGRDFARASHDGPIAIMRHTAVFFAFAAALSLTNCKGFVREMWERAMRAGIVAGGVALALLVGGCDTNDSRFFRYGIGTNLYSEDIVQATQHQDIYLTELCRQAFPMLVTPETVCVNAALSQNDWDLIVQQGLNDIDRRCDAYLAWLDDRRRTNTAVLKQIGDTLAVTQGIMGLSGVGADPITIAGLAFGFATNTFTNVNSRLLLEIDKTTVQTLVLRRRNDYRLQLREVRIANKPAVVHALRSYLNICTPFTIETEINSTITVFQQVGAGGLVTRPPLISPDTVGAPVRATQEVAPPVRRFVPAPPNFAQFFQESLSQSEAELVLNALCLNKNAGADKVTIARALVRIFLAEERPSAEKISSVDREMIMKQRDCGDARNYFEKKVFANTTNNQAKMISAGAVKSLIDVLNRSSAGDQLDRETPLSGTRAKIKAVRIEPSVAAKLTIPIPAQFENQMTPDLFAVLRAPPPRQ